jgi:hypothetical protein
LSLVTGFNITRDSLFALQMVFGASHSVLCLFLKYSIRLLFRVLKDEGDATVALLSSEEISEYQDVVVTNYPALQGGWCIGWAKKTHKKRGVESMQNVYYKLVAT